MTQRIIEVVKAICARPELIEDITRSSREYFFRFKGHFFSVLRRPNPQPGESMYSVYVYPKWTGDMKTLVRKSAYGDDVQMIAYDGSNYGVHEFRALYELVETKDANVDQIFDDVLSEQS